MNGGLDLFWVRLGLQGFQARSHLRHAAKHRSEQVIEVMGGKPPAGSHARCRRLQRRAGQQGQRGPEEPVGSAGAAADDRSSPGGLDAGGRLWVGGSQAQPLGGGRGRSCKSRV